MRLRASDLHLVFVIGVQGVVALKKAQTDKSTTAAHGSRCWLLRSKTHPACPFLVARAETVYGLGANALSEAAVLRIFQVSACRDGPATY